jgi:hypothetical protein
MIIGKINSKNKKFDHAIANMNSNCNCGMCNCNCGSQLVNVNIEDKILELIK